MTKFLDIKKKIDKDHPDVLKSAKELSAVSIGRIPSGVFIFDLLTGGGIPKGRISIFHGIESSGKSSLALRLTAQFLRQHPDQMVLYADFEQTYDHEWAKNFGIDENRCQVIQPDYGESGVDIILEVCKADDIGMIVIDSIAMMIPTAEGEASMSDDFVGLQARLVNKMLRRIIPITSKARDLGKPVTLLFINQVRAKIGGRSFQPQVSMPGGFMQKLVATLNIRFYTKMYTKVAGIPAKVTHTITLEKNKAGLAKRSGEYTVILAPHQGFKAGDVDDLAVVIEYGKKTGLLVKDGAGWRIGKSDKFPNLAELGRYLKAHPGEFNAFKDAVLKICLTDVFLSGNPDDDKDVEG